MGITPDLIHLVDEKVGKILIMAAEQIYACIQPSLRPSQNHCLGGHNNPEF
jgi:hypothetical protein